MGGLNLTTHNLTMSTGKHAPVIVPGNASKSVLYLSLKGEANGVPIMPPGAPLTAEVIDLVARWIDQGAPEN